MNLPPPDAPLRCLPRAFRTKNGSAVELRRLPADAGQGLVDMYLAFQPRNSFQGLPPLKDEVCVRWVQEMLRTGLNVVALEQVGQVGNLPPHAGRAPLIGHVALFPINRQKCEMLVVVCPGFQNLGVGTELVRSCIDLADELGFQRIWLPVDAVNVRARHVYRKCGFEYVDGQLGRELDMACEVRRWRSPPADRGTIAAPHVAVPRFHFADLSPVGRIS
jgi:RimJ/RimL family protein N-acetyltransferase